jgi:glycosyltransferase involved in cell wall biosynthesis
LIAQEREVIVLSPSDSYVPRLVQLGARHIHLELDNTSVNPLVELKTLAALITTLRRERPAVLLTYTPKVNIYCSLAARLLDIPVIANVSGLGRGFAKRGWIRSVSRMLYRVALKHPDVVFFQNEDNLKEFVQTRIIDARRARRLPGSGVDLQRFVPQAREKGDGFRFLLASRLLWEKGVGEYAEAARIIKAEFPQVRCMLVGWVEVPSPSAVPMSEIERWAKEDIIDYLGFTDDMVTHLADADCVVLPSYYREGVPRSLLEAASMEKPVITADMPGCRDAVDDGITGYLCKARTSGDLVEKMRRMITLDYAKRAAMGQAARRKMETEFDEKVIIQRYLSAVSEVLGSS